MSLNVSQMLYSRPEKGLFPPSVHNDRGWIGRGMLGSFRRLEGGHDRNAPVGRVEFDAQTAVWAGLTVLVHGERDHEERQPLEGEPFSADRAVLVGGHDPTPPPQSFGFSAGAGGRRLGS